MHYDAQARPSWIHGICELTLETSDIPALERFYVDVLGLRPLDRSSDRVWLAAGGRTRLGLWSPGAKEFDDRGGSHVHFALSSEPGQLDALAARARTRGQIRKVRSSTMAATAPYT